jgi:hypothetical protein
LEIGTKGWKLGESTAWRIERERESESRGCSPEGEGEKHVVAVGSPVVAGEGRTPAMGREPPEHRDRGREVKK